MSERDVERLKNRISHFKEAVIQANGNDIEHTSTWLKGYMKGVEEIERIVNEEIETSKYTW